MAEKKKVKSDVVLKDFWRQNERFADLFNAVVFQGEEVLKPETLQEMDTDLSGTIRFRDYEESLVRTRDVVKKMAFGVEFAVLGIEAQQRIHYTMPLRALLYDGQLERDINLIHDWLQEGYSVKEIAKLLKRSEEFVKKIQDESKILV